jgi:hypothetical protein
MDDPQQRSTIVAQTLAQLHDSSDALDKITGGGSTALDVYRAAMAQKIEVEDRISTLMNLQLAQDTDAMQALVPQLKQAKANLDSVLATICKASEVVDGVTKFLVVVDALAAAAKAVA